MKKLSFLLFSFLLIQSAFAKSVELEIAISYKKAQEINKETKFKIVAQMDEEFLVPTPEDNPFKLKLNASEDSNSKFLTIKGLVSILEKGSLKLIAQPTVITMLGKQASITSETENGEIFELKVLPTKINN